MWSANTGKGRKQWNQSCAPNERTAKGSEHEPARSPPIVSRFSVLEVPYLDERRLGVVVFDEDDSHTPARVGAQKSTELLERERVIVDVDDGLTHR